MEIMFFLGLWGGMKFRMIHWKNGPDTYVIISEQ